MGRRIAQWKANHARRRGIPNVQIIKDTDKSRWTVSVPLGTKPDALPAMNKAGTLCRKMTSVVFADPPAPDVSTPSGDDEDENASELTVRILEDIQGENQLHEAGKSRQAFDRANVFGSGFIRYYIHPRDEREPIEVDAGFDPLTGEFAQTIQDAAERTIMQPVVDELGMPIMDPETLQPMMQPAGTEPWPMYVTRFVRPDGFLTDEREEAAEKFVPGIRSEVLTGLNVRFLPHTSEDIWDADGVVIAAFLAWSDVKNLFPDVKEKVEGKDAVTNEMGMETQPAQPKDEEFKKKLFAFEPEGADDILQDKKRPKQDKAKGNEDENLVFTLFTYYTPCDRYPKGAYVVSLADCYVAYRDPWELPLPLTQYAQFSEGREDPYRCGLMEIVGAGNEIRAAQVGAWLDHLERFNRPHTFIPTNSTINPKELQLRRGVPIAINPGGEPKYEDVPQFPTDAKEMFTLATEEMDQASMLGNLGQGLDNPSVESGRHALAIISQGHAELSEITENVKRAYVRSCRIQMEMIRAFYDDPRKVQWSGEDGRYREEDWSGSDISESTDVRVKSGTMTMLTPTAKGQLIEHFYGTLGIMDPYDAKEALTTSLGGLLALQDDPHRMRIKRQIHEWKDGPEEGEDPMMAGQRIWQPVPADFLPDVAMVRIREISKLMASKAYLRHPQPWRDFVDITFQNMQMAAAPPPMPGEQDTSSEEEETEARAQGADQNEQAVAEATAMGAL